MTINLVLAAITITFFTGLKMFLDPKHSQESSCWVMGLGAGSFVLFCLIGAYAAI